MTTRGRRQGGGSRRRQPADPGGPRRSFLPPPGTLAAAAVALAGIGGIIMVIAAVRSEGDGGGLARQPPVTPTAVPSSAAIPSPTIASSPTAAPPSEALAEIEALARRSIEALPAGQWPALYDSFTSDFRQRCPRPEFDQAGVQAAADLGENLQRLSFKRLEEPAVEAASAQAVIVGEVSGQGEYTTQASFRQEDGRWKIAPAPGTQGCQAFNRLSG